MSDLGALVSSTLGKLEIESLEEGEDEEVVDKLIKAAVLQTFREHCPPETLGQVIGAFEEGRVVHAGPDLPSQDYVRILDELPAFRTPVRVLTADVREPGRHRERPRARARRAAPLQAPQQGGVRGPGRLPGPLGRACGGLRLLALGRHAGRLRPRRGRHHVRDQRRPHVPRRRRLRRCAGCSSRAFVTATAAASKVCRSCWSASASGDAKSARSTTSAAPIRTSPKSSTEIVEQERRALDDLERDASDSGDERRRQVTGDVVGERRAELGLLPDDLAGRVRGLQSYEFTSSEARERFEELLERLRQEVVQSYLDQVAGAASAMGPEERDHIRNALDALNKMMEQRAAGEALDPGLRAIHGAVRRLVPGGPAEPRRAPRAARPAHGRRLGHARLHVAGPARPAAGAHGRARGRHGPFLAAEPAGGQPPGGLPRRAVGPAHVLRRERGHGTGRNDRHVRAPRRARPARGHAVGGIAARSARRDRPRPRPRAHGQRRLAVPGTAAEAVPPARGVRPRRAT